MSGPPIPPRPYSAQGSHHHSNSLPPPIPPLPPSLRYASPTPYESPPHFDQPLVAPRPHKIDPSIPTNMAQNLDNHLAQQHPPNSNINFNPGFAVPGLIPPQQHQQQHQPPPYGNAWPGSSWGSPQPDSLAPPAQRLRTYSSPQMPPPNLTASPLSYNTSNLSFSSTPQHPPTTYAPPPQKAPSPPSSTPPSLTAPLPTIPLLQSALPNIQSPSFDPSQKVVWARDVLFLVDKQSAHASSSSTDTPVGPAIIHDQALLKLVQTAVPIVLTIASSYQGGGGAQTPGYVAEALYLRATFESSGAYPEHMKQNPRSAFRDFEAAARGGYAAAWFRLGRDYENFNDVAHAKDCFERGVKLGVESCAYRMGMAHLMGQLGLPPNPTLALPLLHRAATLSTPQVPQPAYVYALLLLSEFTQLPSPLAPSLFAPFVPPSSTPSLEARKHLERAAFLGFAPAQYKLGHAYEFAQPPFPFDPLLSVQYYSLASQQGEVEADMALSKWFLCGSGEVGEPGASSSETGGGFEKDESLAWTFADKAARRGLPSAEFAMGYYAEVGVGGPKDLGAAMRWYALAKDHGNKDAADRLVALSQETPQALSRQEHDAITENKLVRKRTMAKERSDKHHRPGVGVAAPPLPNMAPAQQQHQGAYPNPHASLNNPQQHQYQHQQGPGPGPGQGAGAHQNQRPQRRQVLENVRKSSMMIPGAYPSPSGPPPQSQSQAQPHPHPYAQQQPLPQQHSNTLPYASNHPYGAPNNSNPNPSNNTNAYPSPNPRPQRPGSQGQGQGQGQGQFPSTAKRYTLIDGQAPSSAPMSGGPGPGPGGAGRGGRRKGSGSPLGGAIPGGPGGENGKGGEEREGEVGLGLGGGVVYSAKPSKGPATFAEMGFQGAKAEDKDCVVM